MATKKTIAIFCQSLDKNGVPFKDPYYWDAYSDLLLVLTELGARAYFVSDNATYMGGGVFSQAYSLDYKGTVDNLREAGTIQADLVFDRGNFSGKDLPVVNPKFVSQAGVDKINTYKLFGTYQAFSIPCYSKQELQAALASINGEMIVVKRARGQGGHGVYIGTRQSVPVDIPDRYPLLVQEFLDTSVGVPGYVDGIHDLRVEIGGGEIWGCYIRMPKPGNFKANIAQGGSKIILSPKDVPTDVVTIVRDIDSYFKDYPRFYGLDFANTGQGWKLIEINSYRLGLVARSGGEGSIHTLYKLAQYLIDVC